MARREALVGRAQGGRLRPADITGGGFTISNLGMYGVEESQFDALSEMAFADACHQTNPVPVTRADLRALYVASM